MRVRVGTNVPARAAMRREDSACQRFENLRRRTADMGANSTRRVTASPGTTRAQPERGYQDPRQHR
eukprot:2061120-Rhodomonas_salina.3